MRLSWNEVRSRAATFASEWRDAAYEKGETQSFYNDFFDVFGVERRSVARYEECIRKLDNRLGFIDLLRLDFKKYNFPECDIDYYASRMKVPSIKKEKKKCLYPIC